jgi:hypothetical protein
VCGILSVLIGSVGVLYGRRKRDWPHHRLMSEISSPIPFQTLVFRLPEIVASLKNEPAKLAFVSDRKLWLETFKSHFEGKLDSIFVAMINEENRIQSGLHDGLTSPAKSRNS